MLPDSIIRVISAGGNVIIDGSNMLPDTLVRIVSTAASSGVTITITNADSMLPDTAVRIAGAGKKNVVFDFS